MSKIANRPKTPRERVLSYVGFHLAAYGAPAPEDELVNQLVKHCGMNEVEATFFIVQDMLLNQEICFVRMKGSACEHCYVLPGHKREVA